MVLYVVKYNVAIGKEEAYNQWSGQAIKRTLAIPGLVEFRAYRPINSGFRIALTYEFKDLPSWAAWYSNGEEQKLIDKYCV